MLLVNRLFVWFAKFVDFIKLESFIEILFNSFTIMKIHFTF